MAEEDETVVLFIGDSVTDCGRRDDDDRHLGHGYVRLIDEAFAAGGTPVTIVNRGISGNRVADLRDRWTRDAIDVQPDVVTVMIGINDTWRAMDSGEVTTAEAYEVDYRHILDRLVSGTAAQLMLVEPFLLPVTPEQWDWRPDLDPRIAVVRRLAAEYDATLLAADGLLNQLAVNTGGGAVVSGFARYADDGVHLTDEGADVLAAAWIAGTEAV